MPAHQPLEPHRGLGAAALEILAQREVDLVMLDQRMPGEAGVDILPRVKALDPSVVVVIATAVRDVRTAVEALKRGAYDYLIKPFEVDDIIGLADRVLEKRDLEREVVSLRSAPVKAPFSWPNSSLSSSVSGMAAQLRARNGALARGPCW